MDKDVVIKVENLHKKFCRSLKRSMFYGSVDVAKNMLGIKVNTGGLRKKEFWALQDINFEVKKGEALGIIGQNGSGKTTLLRLINGIFPPDKGRISVRGKMGALIAVGAGFHPHMSGRENIYLNGIILGMSKNEIKKKFHEIVDFADIGDFIDAPVATYSSGMTVRLGFSIAIHSSPEILLADEVLAVGDLGFVLKCYRKIAEYREKGGSILLVSHGMQLIRNTCQRVLWIDHGEVKKYGDTQNTCDKYETHVIKKDTPEGGNKGVHINNDPSVRITKVEFLNNKTAIAKNYNVGDYFKVRIYFDCRRLIKNPIFTLGIANIENITVVASYSNMDANRKIPPLSGGYIDFSIEKLFLKPGTYKCTVTLAENELINVLDWHDRSFSFTVISDKIDFLDKTATYGLLQLPTNWKIGY